MTIRLIEHQDSEKLFRLVNENRNDLKTWLGWVESTTDVSVVENFIKRSIINYAEKKEIIFAIFKDNQLAGVCGFNLLDWSTLKGGIGYWLAPCFRGNGIMTKSISELIEYGFNKLGLEICEINAAVDNKSSRAVAERLNFTCTGTIRYAESLCGKKVDHAVYSLLKEEWLKTDNHS